MSIVTIPTTGTRVPRSQRDATIAERAAIPVGVANAERGNASCSARAPRRAVAHRLTVADGSQVDDARAQMRHRSRASASRLRRRPRRTGTHRVARDPTAMHRLARAPDYSRRASIAGRAGIDVERALKATQLLADRFVVRIGRVKVRVRALGRRVREARPASFATRRSTEFRRGSFRCRSTDAMGRRRRVAQLSDCVALAQRGSKLGSTHGRGTRQAGPATARGSGAYTPASRSSIPSATVATPNPHGVEWLERARDAHGAEPVAIGLDDGEERHAGASRERGSISSQRAEVDFDPGAREVSIRLT